MDDIYAGRVSNPVVFFSVIVVVSAHLFLSLHEKINLNTQVCIHQWKPTNYFKKQKKKNQSKKIKPLNVFHFLAIFDLSDLCESK